MRSAPKKIDQLKRLMRKVYKTESCWYWLGCLSKAAYGKTNIGMRSIGAHTAVFEKVTGEVVPADKVLRHSCDTPFCVNPAHLSIGTRSQNAKDMFDRGKWGTGSVWTREQANSVVAPYRELKKKEVEISAIPGLPPDVADRIQKTPTCWLWGGPNDQTHGYGRVFRGGRKYEQAHRFVYAQLVGEIADGLELMHSCDNPRCVNPDHLTPGTTRENARDRQNKDRGFAKPGERHPKARLSENMAKFVLYLVASKSAKQAHIAREMKMSVAAINSLIKGRTWRHLQLVGA